MDIITTNQFSKNKVTETLYMIRDNTKNLVIGYVSKNVEEGFWFYFVRDFVSPEFETTDDAIRGLAEHYTIVMNDRQAQKIGTFNDERYTKR